MIKVNRVVCLNRLLGLFGFLHLYEEVACLTKDFSTLIESIVGDPSSALANPNEHIPIGQVSIKSDFGTVEFVIQLENKRSIEIRINESISLLLMIFLCSNKRVDSDVSIYIYQDSPCIIQMIDDQEITEKEKQLLSEIFNILPEIKGSIDQFSERDPEIRAFLESLPASN